MTNEARVLRLMRKEHGLSLKTVADAVGVSDSLIVQYETGRIDPPSGKRLLALLKMYGGIKEKSFFERVRKFTERLTPKSEAAQLLNRMSESQAQMVIPILRECKKFCVNQRVLFRAHSQECDHRTQFLTDRASLPNRVSA
jgi:transcriptional regulator with XRE-family HTH domain